MNAALSDKGVSDESDLSSPIAPTTGAHDITRAFQTRHLPSSIIVPEIQGEMQLLRPVRIEDLDAMDKLDAFAHSSAITGFSQKAERAVVGTWVRDSVAWSMGDVDVLSAIESRGYERTIGWTMMTKLFGSVDPNELRPIGMIFLTGIDVWSQDARLQVILGRDFRSRGYSRDAMPRVMTFAFGPISSYNGLGLHRVSTFVPGKNQRSLSVYQSIGFTLEGVLRDKLWDDENDEYQDLNILSTLADEYDPIRALDAWGMRVIPSNPGVKEALAAHGHSIEIQKQADLKTATFKTPADFNDARAHGDAPEQKAPLNPRSATIPTFATASRAKGSSASFAAAASTASVSTASTGSSAGSSSSSANSNPDSSDSSSYSGSKRAWWRRWFHGEASTRAEHSNRSASHSEPNKSHKKSAKSTKASAKSAKSGESARFESVKSANSAESAETANIRQQSAQNGELPSSNTNQ